jgi:hypothetical protein
MQQILELKPFNVITTVIWSIGLINYETNIKVKLFSDTNYFLILPELLSDDLK